MYLSLFKPIFKPVQTVLGLFFLLTEKIIIENGIVL